jgi:dihydroorotase
MTHKNVLIKNILVIDPRSSINRQRINLGIVEGKISINIPTAAEIEIDGSNLAVSPGLFDFQVSGGEPGHEEKETVSTLATAALNGGVTGLQLMPNLLPATDNRGSVEYLRSLASRTPVTMIPAGALSVNLEGKDMAEMADMFSGGARAFTDDKKSIKNPVLLHLALQYAKISGGLILTHAEESAMRLGGKINEGLMSVQLGMIGAPSISEEIGLMRNLALAEYHQAEIHILGISSKKSVSLIREAKANGIKVTCSVYAHQLYFSDEALAGFDSNLKVWPPLRSELDRQALILGVQDGTIDVISSDHRPETIENKAVEFGFASDGISGIETLFSAARTAMFDNTELETLIQCMAISPRELLGVQVPVVEHQQTADLFFYNPDEEFTFTKEQLRSKSKNNPFIGKTLRGKIYGVSTNSGCTISER